jgi:hypothetical protein
MGMTAQDIEDQDSKAIRDMLALLPVGDPRRAIWESLGAEQGII